MTENTCVSFDKLVKNSDAFFEKNVRPTDDNYAHNYKLKEQETKIEKYANEAHPLMHEKSLKLAENFLTFKKENGSPLEKEIYKEMNILDFIDRLICKRPLVFVGPKDVWMAKDSNAHEPSNLSFYWDDIGMSGEEKRKMDNFLTYDEVKVAALILMSSQTMLINNGNRDNEGERTKDPEEFIEDAVYVGAVGARFERMGKMEYQDIIVEKEQNLSELGYGLNNEEPTILKVFAESLYNIDNFPTFDEINENEKLRVDHHEAVGKNVFFNRDIYKMRMKIVLETFLLEANKRGEDSGRKVYCHVVGLGLGVWEYKLYKGQKKQFLTAFAESLNATKKKLGSISDIDFSWIGEEDINELVNGKDFPESNMKIHFSKRNPFDALPEEKSEKLMVAMFAWDGNSYVGNEYWAGALSSSGDPAAASCSLIPELMNPDINPRVKGNNLHVASPEFGVLPFDEYEKHPS